MIFFIYETSDECRNAVRDHMSGGTRPHQHATDDDQDSSSAAVTDLAEPRPQQDRRHGEAAERHADGNASASEFVLDESRQQSDGRPEPEHLEQPRETRREELSAEQPFVAWRRIRSGHLVRSDCAGFGEGGNLLR